MSFKKGNDFLPVSNNMSHYAWDAIRAHVTRKIAEAAGEGVEVAVTDLTDPPKPDLGELAYGCFSLAKKFGRSPAEIAKDLAGKIKSDHVISSASSSGPYVNLVLSPIEVTNRVVRDVERLRGAYGRTDTHTGATVMLEYAQPNTHKEIHVGHLRNLVLGASLAKMLQRSGWRVVTASYHGDVGAHVSKCLWYLVRNKSGLVPQTGSTSIPEESWAQHVLQTFNATMAQTILNGLPATERTGNTLGKLYAESTKVLEENPDWKAEVSAVQLALEAKHPGWMELWRETKRWCVEEMNAIFSELGAVIDRQYFESEVVDVGQRMVDDLLTNNVARVSEGAVVVDLEEEKLGMFLIRKSDGTSLYATKDLALAFLKKKEQPELSLSMMLVDNRQSLYFKQLFRTLELLKVGVPQEFVGYEFVTLASGAMSSRDGNVVTWQSFREEVMKKAREETRKRHADWAEGQIEHSAWCVAMAAVKFGMLKIDGDRLIVFDLEKAMAVDGDTGPYVLYAAKRLSSILKKANWSPHEQRDEAVTAETPSEKSLALVMAAFPSVLAASAEQKRPNLMAHWLLRMSHACTDFYHNVNVLQSEEVMQTSRLRLVAAAETVMILGLDALGISLPEEM